MKGECLSCSVIPHSTALFLDYLYHFPRVRRFYTRPPFAREWLSEEAASLRYDEARRQAVASVLERQNRSWQASAATFDNLARLRGGAAAIVTGQQVGLFGGPLMGLLKALSAIRLAAEATSRGVECVPVFWMASEDHDLAEVNHAVFPADDGLRSLVTSSHGVPDAPAGTVSFQPEIEELVAEACSLLPECDARELLARCYRSGETFSSAFARLYADLLGEFGIILLDAADPELDRIAAPVYRAAVSASADLREALTLRGAELRASGYHEQVKITPSSTLLFRLRDGARIPLQATNGDFRLAEQEGNGSSYSAQELETLAVSSPEQLSPNALLRPVVQDYLLPTLAYLGGPSEVAYFAQAAVVYEQLLGRVTPILPRLSATLLDARAQRLLAQYDLKLTELFIPPEQFQRELATRTLPSDLQLRFSQMREFLERSLKDTKHSLVRLDPTLADAAERASSKMLYQLESLEGRTATVLARRNAEVKRHADWLSSNLYPNKNLQEREIAGIWFVARHGRELLRRIYESAQDGCPDHQVMYL